MTEDYATMKQIEFMKKLGFPPQSADLTKAEARQMIDEKLRESEKMDVQRVPGGVLIGKDPLGPCPARKDNGIHLTPESVKLGALNAAVALRVKAFELNQATFNTDELLKLANKFVEWIYS